MPTLDDKRAAALMDIAERLIRLPAHDRRRPHAFTEDKSELVAEIRVIARALGDLDISHRQNRQNPLPPSRPRRVIVQTDSFRTSTGKLVVRQERKSFAIG